MKILTILIIVIISTQIVSALNPESLTVLSKEDAVRGRTTELIIRAKNESSIYRTEIKINTTKGISINKSNFDERNQLIVILNIGNEAKLGENRINITSTDERILLKEIIIIVNDPKTTEQIIDSQKENMKYLTYLLIGVGFLVLFIIILTLVMIDLSRK